MCVFAYGQAPQSLRMIKTSENPMLPSPSTSAGQVSSSASSMPKVVIQVWRHQCRNRHRSRGHHHICITERRIHRSLVQSCWHHQDIKMSTQSAVPSSSVSVSSFPQPQFRDRRDSCLRNRQRHHHSSVRCSHSHQDLSLGSLGTHRPVKKSAKDTIFVMSRSSTPLPQSPDPDLKVSLSHPSKVEHHRHRCRSPPHSPIQLCLGAGIDVRVKESSVQV